MAMIEAARVKKLRDATNVSMMECKRALEEAQGDMEKATRLLRERGMAIATKKAGRATNQGLIATATSPDGRTASLVELNCETDFVARNSTFQAFAQRVAQRACETDGNLADELKPEITAKVAEIGENIVLKRNARFVLQGAGRLGSYIHPGAKIGVLVEVACGKPETVDHETFRELVKDLTLHVTASAPLYLTAADVPADVIATEREIYAKQITNKPPPVVAKIVDGKLKKYFTEVCLVEQVFVKDAKLSVTALLAEKGKALGDTLTIRRFLRYLLGE